MCCMHMQNVEVQRHAKSQCAVEEMEKRCKSIKSCQNAKCKME